MIHTDLRSRRKDIGTFVSYESGYYAFILENKEEIVFEEINKEVLEQFNLRNGEYKGLKFQLIYDEIVDDEDYVIYRLEQLNEF